MDSLTNTHSLSEQNKQLIRELDRAYELIKNYETLIAELKKENDHNLKTIAHDLSNPLQILSMTIESLQESPPKDLAATLERMRRSTNVMVDIISAIRNLRSAAASVHKKNTLVV